MAEFPAKTNKQKSHAPIANQISCYSVSSYGFGKSTPDYDFQSC